MNGVPNNPNFVAVISGGNYPAGSFSIGHGVNNVNGDGGPGADTVHTDLNGNRGNGLTYPTLGRPQNGAGNVNAQNDITSHRGLNTQNGANNVPIQNPGNNPTNPYEDHYTTPVPNSASKVTWYSRVISWMPSWFY